MSVPGLRIVEGYLSPEEEKTLLEYLDQEGRKKWNTSLKARQQQFYGCDYDYRSGNSAAAPPLDGPLLLLGERLRAEGYIAPNQAIVNEYGRSQGISAHTDAAHLGPIVVGVSLGSPARMDFSRQGLETISMYLPPRSLMVMEGDARWMWKHAISPRVTYVDASGSKVAKPHDYRRVSITFRAVP